MKYCNCCQLNIRGNQAKCPLCKNKLPISEKDYEDILPEIPPSFESHLAVKIMIFLSIAIVVISYTLQYIFHSKTNWTIFVLFGLLNMWLSAILVIQKRHHIVKNIMWQVTVVSVLSVIWDLITGWRGWSLDFVIPISCVVAMLVMYLTAKVMHLSVRDYIVYFLLDGLFGIIPIAFILFGWVNVIYPSIICVAISILFTSAIFIFHGENIKNELGKRMHL